MKTIQSIKKSATIVALLVVSVLPTSLFAQSSEVNDDTRAEIEKLNHSIENAFVKNSMGDVAAMYNAEATILTPGGKKIHGSKEIGEYWYAMSGCKEFKSEITELGGSGKMIYQLGKWTKTFEKDGKLVTHTTDVVLVWKRESNYEYKIQLSSLNNTVAVSEKEILPNSASAK